MIVFRFDVVVVGSDSVDVGRDFRGLSSACNFHISFFSLVENVALAGDFGGS